MKQILIAFLAMLVAMPALAGTNILDSSGNTIYQDVASSGTLTGAGNSITATLRGQTSAFVQVTVIGGSTLVFEGTVDNANWFSVNAAVPTTGALVTTTTTTGQWMVSTGGLVGFRVRCSVYSANATLFINASQGTDLSALFAPLPTGTNVIGALSANQSSNVAQFGGTNVSTGTGAGGAGIPRVTVSNDSSLAANQSVNVAQIAAAATSTAAAGVQKVGIVGNANGALDAATAAAVPANAIYNGARAATANPTNATGGNMVGLMGDKAGKLVTTAGCPRELVGVQTTTISASTAETTIVTAGGASVFNDISSITMSSTDILAAVVTIKDATAGTTRLAFNYPPTAAVVQPLYMGFPIPIAQATANANWTATMSANAGSIIINVTFCKNL